MQQTGYLKVNGEKILVLVRALRNGEVVEM